MFISIEKKILSNSVLTWKLLSKVGITFALWKSLEHTRKSIKKCTKTKRLKVLQTAINFSTFQKSLP